jgi:multidrug resistance protein
MPKSRLSPNTLLILLAIAVFMSFIVIVMLGPLLVDLAKAFRTSVAVAGQLAAVTALAWAFTAPLAGPLSDTYGRRLIILIGLMLTAIGTLSSALAWNYSSLMTFRFLTGFGAAVIGPNSIATVVDIFPPKRRGRALGWLISSLGFGAAFGVPIVALLTDFGGWRLPFFIISIMIIILWCLLWLWLPRSATRMGNPLNFTTHFREAGSKAVFWYLLISNCLMNMTFMGVSNYQAAYLMKVFHLDTGQIAFPMMIAGLGVTAGSLIGGRLASLNYRLVYLSISLFLSGLTASLVFTMEISPWITVVLSFATQGLIFITSPVIALLLTELAGQSRATATGLFAVSNQFGIMGGASIGGLMLSIGGFHSVGLFCSAAAVFAAMGIGFKVRETVANPNSQ